jgi:hypothetical protein
MKFQAIARDWKLNAGLATLLSDTGDGYDEKLGGQGGVDG